MSIVLLVLGLLVVGGVLSCLSWVSTSEDQRSIQQHERVMDVLCGLSGRHSRPD
jgi:hypothetical protein